MSITRRDFIACAVSVAALCAVGGPAEALPASNELLRPPGGQDEGAFISSCLRCDRCRSVCPTNCIDFSHIEDGVIDMRTPKMNYHLGDCVFCNKCVGVCPTNALHAIDPSTDKIGVAVVQESQCVAFKNPGSCSKCAEVCPYGAVTMQDEVPVVDASRCNGCGVCVYQCPALIYTSSTDTSRRGIEVFTVGDYEGGRVS